MNQELSHILEQSVCLSKRQLTDYISNRLEPEELHAVETHLLSCPLCSMAVEGLVVSPDESLAALSTLNTDFLKEHFEKSLPQIHLNSVVSAAIPAAHRSTRRKGDNTLPLLRTASIAAGILLCVWGAWALSRQLAEHRDNAPVIASNYEAVPPSQSGTTAADQTASPMTDPPGGNNTGAPAEMAVAAAPIASETSPVPVTPPATAGEVRVPATTLSKDAASPAVNGTTGNGLGAATGNSYQPYNASPAPTRMTDRASFQEPAASQPVAVQEEREEVEIAATAARKSKSPSRAATAPDDAVERAEAKADAKLEDAKESYDKGDYQVAVAQSKAAAAGAPGDAKDEASLVTARSYIKLGQKDKARAILLKLKDNKGATGRQARRMLNRLDD